jgi:integrase
LKPHNGKQRRVYLDNICRSIHPENGKPRGDLQFAKMKRANVIAIRDTIVEAATSANSYVAALRCLFNWGIENEIATYNPCFRVDELPSSRDGHHTWTESEMAKFEEHHPIGTRARLAFAIIAYTGVRLSDTIRLGPKMARKGSLHFTEFKGSDSHVLGKQRPIPKHRVIEIAPELQEIIDATVTGVQTYLVSSMGRQYREKHFSRNFRQWCDDAGLPHCTAHGIRKFDATFMAENGATNNQLMGMFGWTNSAQADVYTRKVDRAKLASQGVHLLSMRQRQHG